MRNTEVGTRGEDIATGYLSDRGYRIIERNWHCGRGVHCVGEIDIIAQKDSTLYFIEVKCRVGGELSGDFSPESALTPKKLERIYLAIDGYLKKTNYLGNVNMALIAINILDSGEYIRFYDNIRIH